MTIQAELSADEKVLWTGHADRVPLFVTADLLLVPFTFIWAGGAIAFAVSGATRNPGTLPCKASKGLLNGCLAISAAFTLTILPVFGNKCI